MDLDEITLAEVLKDLKYKTFFAGKWHLGPRKEWWPKAQGFDINMGGWAKGGPYTGKKYFSPFKNPELHPDSPEGEHLQTDLADETVNSLVRIRTSPFSPTYPFTPFTPRFREERIWSKNIRNGPPRFREKNLVRSMIAKSGFFKNMQSMPPWWKPWMKQSAKFSQRLIKQVLPKIPWSFLPRIMVGFPHPRAVQPATFLFAEVKGGCMREEFVNHGLSDTPVLPCPVQSVAR
jgi:hypothetical protein